MFHKTQEEIMSTWDKSIQKPLCSVICITYNHVNFIEQALDSFLEQVTTFPFNIIIHDDCSTDGTEEIIKKYEAKYPKIINAMYETENQYSKGGLANNFWVDMHKMAAKYIATCEGDDYWNDCNKLQIQVDFLEKNNNYVVCYHDFIMPSFDKDGSEVEIKYYGYDKDRSNTGLQLQRREVFIGLRVACYKNVIDWNNPNIKHYASRIECGDVFLNILLGEHGDAMYISSINPAYYRLHAGGIYSSLNDEDRITQRVRVVFLISLYFNSIRKDEISSYILLETLKTICNSNIKFKEKDFKEFIKFLFKHYKFGIPTSLGIKMGFSNIYFSTKKYNKQIKCLKEKIRYTYIFNKLQQSSFINYMPRFIRKKINKIKERERERERERLNTDIRLFCKSNKLGILFNNNPFFNKKNSRQTLIISLTSYPKRINQIHYTIYSLLTQTHKPDKVILWLSTEEFPNKDLPQSLTRFQNNGLEIAWCNKNIKSYKKLIYSLERFQDSLIATADDDIFYPPFWLERLYNSYLENPNFIHCHRAHRVTLDCNNNIIDYMSWEQEIESNKPSFLNFFTGAGGVLFPPNSLYKDILDSKIFMELCPNGDDIWFWTMAVLNETKINVIKDNHSNLLIIDEKSQDTALWKTNLSGDNDIQISNVLKHYPQLKHKLKLATIG